MRKIVLLTLLMVLLLLVFACSNKGTTDDSQQLLDLSWNEIEQLASDSEIRLFMWGGDDGINSYIDNWVAPLMEEKYNIIVTRTPMDINEVLQKLMTEKSVELNDGSIDIFWLNGENFANAKNNQLLWDSFSHILPNFQRYIDTSQYEFDFGTPVEGYEAPWGKVQFVFYYDAEKIANPPTNFSELATWIEQNPGKFTYPEATDFTGNAFLRHLLYEFVARDLLRGDTIQTDELDRASVEVWQYLNDIKPNLWREGKTYPQSLAQLDSLYSQGEIEMTMGYNEARAESLIKNGTFPSATKSFVLEIGSIGNTHFLSIPFNSPNKAGALVTINELLSPEAQLAKMDANMWGENTVLSIDKLPETTQMKFNNVERGNSVLPANVLEQSFLQELSINYVEWIKEKWLVEVIQKK